MVTKLVVVLLMLAFLPFNHGAEAAQIRPCSKQFVNAWNAWDRASEEMPTLPKESCRLLGNYRAYMCGEEVGGCTAAPETCGPDYPPCDWPEE